MAVQKNEKIKEAKEQLHVMRVNRTEQEIQDAYMTEEFLRRMALYKSEQKGRAMGKIELAKNLIKRGISIELIKEQAGLSDEEFKEVMS